MATEKQIAANRRNAQLSTGPRTAEGMARVAGNAITHGLTASTPVLSDEEKGTYDALRERLYRQYGPVVALAAELVEEATSILWRLRRVPAIECAIFERGHWEEKIAAARDAVRSSNPNDQVLSLLGGAESGATGAAQAELQKVEEAAQQALTIGASGFLRDAFGADMLDKLTKYESRLQSRLFTILRELERLQAQCVEVEVAAEETME